MRHGNIIELANTTVGVEEACSGVRSLISCVFAGFVLSATLLRRAWPRAVLIGIAAPLALAMNFLRSLFLTLLSNRGVDITGTWHDVTGFAVLGVTAALLGGLALLLEHGRAEPALRAAGLVPAGRSALQRPLTAAFAAAFGLVVFFVINTRPAINHERPVPDLDALLPETAPGWLVRTSDLYEFTGTLRTEHLVQRRYLGGSSTHPIEITVYVAYWRPGQAPVSLVASHTPDACWPGSGWNPVPTSQPQTRLIIDQRTLPEVEYREFSSGQDPQHVWFWHLYDGRALDYRDPYSPAELLRIALRYGFRKEGEQLFVRVSSNRPWDEISAAPVLAGFFSRLQPFGL
jgi:exosortase/archaeosortase family protein